MLSSLQALFNRLLPFATPGTPILHDLLHLAALCTVLYFAPQIQAYFQRPPRTVEHAHDEGVEGQVYGAGQGDGIGEREAGVGAHVENAQQQQQDDNARVHNDPARRPVQHDDDNEALDDNDDGDPGPANPAARAAAAGTNTRNVGAKKAKSLARRDQRRAYHEFMRSQGEAQRARDAEDSASREADAASERSRRAAVETELRTREAAEREERRERERRARAEEIRRREVALGLVREEVAQRGFCDVADVGRRVGAEGRDWVEGLVRASGMLGSRGGEMVMITERGWVVKVREEDVGEMYRIASSGSRVGDDEGKISFQQLGGVLENVLRSRAAAV